MTTSTGTSHRNGATCPGLVSSRCLSWPCCRSIPAGAITLQRPQGERNPQDRCKKRGPLRKNQRHHCSAKLTSEWKTRARQDAYPASMTIRVVSSPLRSNEVDVPISRSPQESSAESRKCAGSKERRCKGNLSVEGRDFTMALPMLIANLKLICVFHLEIHLIGERPRSICLLLAREFNSCNKSSRGELKRPQVSAVQAITLLPLLEGYIFTFHFDAFHSCEYSGLGDARNHRCGARWCIVTSRRRSGAIG